MSTPHSPLLPPSKLEALLNVSNLIQQHKSCQTEAPQPKIVLVLVYGLSVWGTNHVGIRFLRLC